jgi:hypothetical protein
LCPSFWIGVLLGAILIPRIGLEFAFLGIKIALKSIPAGRRGAKRYKVEFNTTQA